MKIFKIGFNILCFSFMLMIPAFAYIDPSVTTYMIQAIAGIVIILGGAIGVFWRKAKKKAKDALHINEKTKKEIEDDIIEISNEDNAK